MENSDKLLIVIMIFVSFLLSVTAVVWFCIKKAKQRKSLEEFSRIGVSTPLVISGFIILAIWTLRFAIGYFSIFNPKDGIDSLSWGEEIINSLFGALRTFSLEEEYKEYILNIKSLIASLIPLSHWSFKVCKYGLIVYATLLNLAAPGAGGAIVLELLSGIFPNIKLRFAYAFSNRKKCFFSELNAQSLALAKSIGVDENGKKPIIIFTDTYIDKEEEKEYELFLEAKHSGAICVRDDLSHVIKPAKGNCEYYLMDSLEFGNLQTLMRLVEDNNVKYVKDSFIYLFVQTDAYVQIEKRINESFENGEKAKLLGDGKKPVIIPINAYRHLVQNLFREIPLYEPLINKKGDKNLDITILGNGLIGTEAFFNAYCFSQMLVSQTVDGKEELAPCNVTINVVSRDSKEEFWSKIDYVNPEIRKTVEVIGKTDKEDDILAYNASGKNVPYCKVRYINSDVKIGEFWNEKNDLKNRILSSDYYIVALGNDSDNICVAEKLQLYIGKKHLEEKKEDNVIIAYAVFDSGLSKNLNMQNAYCCRKNDRYDIYMHSFGSLEELYSCDNVSMSKSKLLQIGISNAYVKAQHIQNHISRIRKKEESNYNHWADIARALHIKYKVFSAGLIEKSLFDYLPNKTEEYKQYINEQCDKYKKIAAFEAAKEKNASLEIIGDDSLKQAYFEVKNKEKCLAWLEHRRWCAFTRTLGYRYTNEYKTNFALTGKSHKNMALKLHPCLTEAKFPLLNSNETYMQDCIKALFVPFAESFSDGGIAEKIEYLKKEKQYFENKIEYISTLDMNALDFLDRFSCNWCEVVTKANIADIEKALTSLEQDVDIDIKDVAKNGCYDFKLYDSYRFEFEDFVFANEIIEKLEQLKISKVEQYCNINTLLNTVCCNTDKGENYLVSVDSVKGELSKNYIIVSKDENIINAFDFYGTRFAAKTNVNLSKVFNLFKKGSNVMYKPKPIDTSGAVLPKELVELTEKIAENVHENWAAGRIADGWIYGESRNDTKKETPCLVPYEQLTEEEKEFDRKTALETLKLIISLGYKIEKE